MVVRKCRLGKVTDERVQEGSIRQRLIVPVISTNSNLSVTQGRTKRSRDYP